ncbi:acyl-CoA thioesterase [Sporolactobacillus shoreicorticis]|uniref:Acyl-CoA thioesterase n=1 Tax=Sporolactobacillus shoreicorticis TaxID=1923877 RepID=A0ABW5RYG4_9BACL|nr:thioesterase family protein [Sporolactobacillus shoreicorticis]MCO7124834.1 acyl-CoA thioesterase [Sporolactobacillus shoreicorticis]
MNGNTTKIVVRYNETDKMGVVHHSHYVNYFEVARTDYIQKLGISYRKVEEQGFMMPVLGIDVHYHAPALYDDTLLVETTVGAYDSIKLTFDYKIYREKDRKLLVDGSSSHCWTDLSLRPVSIRRKNPELHALIVKASEQA